MTSLESALPAAARPADFPGWLPPMLVKELRQGLRAKGFVGLFVSFQLLAIAVFWWTIEVNGTSGVTDTLSWINGLYWSLLSLVVLLVMPLRGLGGLRTEIDNKTLDLLMLTHLTSWRIVAGKWVAIMAQTILFMVALLPYGMVRYFFGSVDLYGDLIQSGCMLLVSGVLSAVALWVSGLPKIFRILLPIALVFGAQGMGVSTVLSRAFSGRAGAYYGAGSGGMFWYFGWGQVILFTILLAVFLGLAVRRIAPPAENHSLVARLLGLLILLGAGVAPLCVAGISLRNAAMVGIISIFFVAVVELSRDCLPMSAHWRPWRQGGIGRSWVGRLLLPGWPSAALFAAFVLTLLAMPAIFSASWRSTEGSSVFAFVWWLVLAWQALVFPAIILSYLPRSSSLRVGGMGYFVLQGLFGILGAILTIDAKGVVLGAHLVSLLNALCQVLPISSFWMAADQMKTGFTAGNVIGQAVVLIVLVTLTWRQSRLYWGTITRFDHVVVTQPPAKP